MPDTSRPGRPQPRSLRILVVEDEPDTRAVLVTALQLSGHDVSHVDNGYDALVELARPGRHDLVVLDIVMPGLSGLELLDRARAADMALPPVLLVSAVADLEVFRTAIDAGATGYLVKPFLPRELVEKVDEVMLSASTGAA